MTFVKCKGCGSRNLANDDGEIVCRNCGVVDIEGSLNAHIVTTEIMGKAASANHHQPVDALKIVEIGSQHDMSSKGTIGTAMELCNPRAKDHEKHKISAGLLTQPYVVGQYVGKDSVIIEIPAFNVWYSCGHSEKFEQKYDGDSYCMSRHAIKYVVFTSPLAVHHHIVEVYEHTMPKAKRNFRNDTIFRKLKVDGNALASKMEMDFVRRNEYNKELKKVFDEFVGVTDFLAVLALLRLRVNMLGLDVNLPESLMSEYDTMLEKLRLFAQTPVEKAQLVTA